MEHDVEFMAKASLGEKLETVIKNLPSTEVTLIEILESIGHESLMFLTIFLSMVFLYYRVINNLEYIQYFQLFRSF